jgi:hypothetical protein
VLSEKARAGVSQLSTLTSQPVFLLPAFTPAEAGIGRGKSYPVTAAQLLPVFTGFLAPIHCFKLAKNCLRPIRLRRISQDLFALDGALTGHSCIWLRILDESGIANVL